jgi:hypothetical protein
MLTGFPCETLELSARHLQPGDPPHDPEMLFARIVSFHRSGFLLGGEGSLLCVARPFPTGLAFACLCRVVLWSQQ